MNKHTPGPWRVRELVNGDLAIYGQGEYEAIAPRKTGILTPDAYLIAAAPELFDALMALLMAHNSRGCLCNLCDNASKALAKARGWQ